MPTERSPETGIDARLSVGFVCLSDFTLLPFSAFIDVLRLATDEGDRSRQRACRWTVMSADGAEMRASCGNVVRPDGGFVDPDRFDYLVVVGGLLHSGQQSSGAVDDYIVSAAARGVRIVGLCTAVFTLIRLGLMSNRRCCVSWYHYWDLKKAFPDVTPIADRLFVVDGPVITCAGGTAAVDLAAWIVARHLGDGVADKALHILLADRARPADAPQPQVVAGEAPDDPRVERAMTLAEQNLADPPSVPRLAHEVGISRRQLERIFRAELGMSPWQYLLSRRLQQGHWLLTETSRTVTDIALACGFADASHFSRHVRRAFGTTPQVLRETAAESRRAKPADGATPDTPVE